MKLIYSLLMGRMGPNAWQIFKVQDTGDNSKVWYSLKVKQFGGYFEQIFDTYEQAQKEAGFK